MSDPLSPRRTIAVGLLAILSLELSLGVWGTHARLAGAVMAQGQVEVDENRQVVQNPDGGVVALILVHDGDRVTAGQVMLVLDGRSLKSQREQMRNQYRELQARQARLIAERDGAAAVSFPSDLMQAARARPEVAAMLAGQSSLYSARRETFDRQLAELSAEGDQIRQEAEGIAAQAAAVARQLELVGQDLATQTGLQARGLARADAVRALQRQQAELEGQLGALRAGAAGAESRQAQTEIEALKLRASRREDAVSRLRDISAEVLTLAEKLKDLDAQIDRLEVRAPASGIAYDVAVTTPNQVIRPADPLLYIVPQDRPLVVSAQVPPTAVADVLPGTEVRLRILAFHDRLAPDATGTVTTVSPDRLTDARTGRDYYRVRIALAPGEVEGGGNGREILPGMPVEAFIRTGEQTALGYLLGPVAAYFRRAFRES